MKILDSLNKLISNVVDTTVTATTAISNIVEGTDSIACKSILLAENGLTEALEHQAQDHAYESKVRTIKHRKKLARLDSLSIDEFDVIDGSDSTHLTNKREQAREQSLKAREDFENALKDYK